MKKSYTKKKKSKKQAGQNEGDSQPEGQNATKQKQQQQQKRKNFSGASSSPIVKAADGDIRFEGFDRYRTMKPVFMVLSELVEMNSLASSSEQQGGVVLALPPARFSGQSTQRPQQQKFCSGGQTHDNFSLLQDGSFLPKSYVAFRGQDADLQVAFKGLSKKDGKTKLKSVQALVEQIPSKPMTELKRSLEAYTYWFPHLLVENDRRLRAESARLLCALVSYKAK